MMYKVFLSILETFLAFGVGALALRLKMIEPGDLGRLTRLTLEMFFPMLTFATITRNFDPNKLNELWIMPLLGFLIMLFGFGVGSIAKRYVRGQNPGREGAFLHICAVNNYVFLPIIILQSAWGDRHVALLLLMNVGSTIGFWTIGIMAFHGQFSWQMVKKSIWSINVAAVAAALLVSVLRIPIPEPVAYTVQYLGNITVPLMLVVIGAALVSCFKGALLHWFDLLYLSVLRLVAIPAAVLSLLVLFHFPAEVYQTVAVVALMPAASSSVLVARQYGGDQSFTGQAIIFTTLLSLGTIPFFMWLFF